jgi:predicted hydrolase (HD superfamily)
MNRQEALTLVHEYIKNPKMISHCLASEAVMIALAKHLGRDEQKWGLAGLLHDLDVEVVNDDPKIH